MSDAAQLPKIKAIEAQTPTASASAVEASALDSAITDGGQSIRPRSGTTSSEGNTQSSSKKSPTKLTQNAPTSRDASGETPSSPSTRSPTAIDPLSHHILKRTNTENIIPQKLRNTNTGVPDSPNPDAGGLASPVLSPSGRQLTTDIARSDGNPTKEKKKGVSFLSRFSIIGGKKKDQDLDIDDDESELGDARTEGMNAHVFTTSSIDANGYIPQHKEPPRYIKVRPHNKKEKEFNRMFLAQELTGTKHEVSDEKVPGLTTVELHPSNGRRISKSSKTDGAVWATEFSKDGKYFAAAGQDQVVRVWAVISTPEERKSHEQEEDSNTSERLSAPVFKSKPVREFHGHTGDILDLSWSKNSFLLSSSMDKSVRLWHISRQECLCTFKHKDFVTSIAFHPKDDRFFLAGSLDSVLRLWSIPDKSVAFWNQLPDLITAVAFTPDGKTAMAGVLNGLCLFYETEGLKYHTQIHVRSSRGKNAKGSKITGIRTMIFPPDDPDGDLKVLITSNDSRIRMYNMRDKSLEMKFRGHENTCSQINASFSDDAHYIICGSEDRKAYIWSTETIDAESKDKRPVEFFEAHSDMVTAAVIAPAKSRQLLSASGDPIYDLCNPPPVTLLSREESYASSMTQTGNASDKRRSDPVSESQLKKPEESPAYIARSNHMDGNIIITADYRGRIKVFRQDCAFQKRRHDHWETGSIFSKKMLGRSNSIMTRHSGGSHSRRNSVSQNSLSSPSMHSDQILSWRNQVSSNTSLEASLRNGPRGARNDRSISPGKVNRSSLSNLSNSTSQNTLASTARQHPNAGTPLTVATFGGLATNPPTSIDKPPSNNNSQPPTPGFSIHSASDDSGQRLDALSKGSQYWNIAQWKPQIIYPPTDPSKLGGDLRRPPLDQQASFVSKLSSDGSVEDDESDGEALSCRVCGSKDFRARKVTGKGQKLVCTKCGTTAQ